MRLARSILLLALCLAAPLQAQRSGMEAEDIRVAEHAILASLVIWSSPQGSSLRAKNPLFALEGDPVELAIAVIAGRRSPASLHALAALYRFNLDGAYSENLDEYVCEAGRHIEKHLSTIKPEELRAQCVSEFTEFNDYASRAAGLEATRVEYVCRNVDSIRSELKQALEMVGKPRQSCEP